MGRTYKLLRVNPKSHLPRAHADARIFQEFLIDLSGVFLRTTLLFLRCVLRRVDGAFPVRSREKPVRDELVCHCMHYIPCMKTHLRACDDPPSMTKEQEKFEDGEQPMLSRFDVHVHHQRNVSSNLEPAGWSQARQRCSQKFKDRFLLCPIINMVKIPAKFCFWRRKS